MNHVLTGMLFISSGTCICATTPITHIPSTHNDDSAPDGHIFNVAPNGDETKSDSKETLK